MSFIVLISACSPDLEQDPAPEEHVFIPDQIQWEVVYIPFPVNISVDGDLLDWNDFPAYLVNKGLLLATDPEENGWFLFSIAADLNNFYITMQMPDQNIIAGRHGT